jgi:hypothetical protein
MYPFPMTMGLGAHEPFPMQATAQAMQQMGHLGQTQPPAQPVAPPINWLHIGGGALAGLAAGWFLYKK